jgi:hypothetical protein
LRARKWRVAQFFSNLLCNNFDAAQIAFRQRDHTSFHPEICQDLQMLFGLRHPAVVGGDNKEREIN